ncbi:MAG: PHP domain-containing protein [Clostridia bacterium]|nr:PHP domain-containing protein [Clostridia bacterium]
MKKTFSYDLHVHSCLSPCADDDMTPGNIAGMAAVQGLDVVALTDHNSAKNCPAFFAHAEKFGIIPIAGMELTTAEDIHMLCLFPTLEAALKFDAVVEESLIKVKNKPRIFGNQYIMNGDDEVAGEVEHLLINATSIDVASAWRMCLDLGGACYPAHIDRDSNGMLAVLGDFPEDVPFAAFELNDKQSYHSLAERLPHLKEKRYVVSSDAHNLWSVSEAENTVVLDGDDKALSLIKYLRGES